MNATEEKFFKFFTSQYQDHNQLNQTLWIGQTELSLKAEKLIQYILEFSDVVVDRNKCDFSTSPKSKLSKVVMGGRPFKLPRLQMLQFELSSKQNCMHSISNQMHQAND